MSEIVKIVGIKKTLKKDTTDVFYWNIFMSRHFLNMIQKVLLRSTASRPVWNLLVKILVSM